MGSHGGYDIMFDGNDDYDDEEDPLRSEEFLIYVPILSTTDDKLPPPPSLTKKKKKQKRKTKLKGALMNDTAATAAKTVVVAGARATARPPSLKLRNGNDDDEKERIGHDSSPSDGGGGGGGGNSNSSKGKGNEPTTTTMIPIRSKQKKTVQISNQSQVTTLTVEETEDRFILQHDLWYQRAELAEKRKEDCQRLIVALRAMHHQRTTGSNNKNNNVNINGSMGVGDRNDDDDNKEPFCFRGLEIVHRKKQRDEVKKRAAQMVFLEQRRFHNLSVANTHVNAAATVLVECSPRKVPVIPQPARETRAEGDSSSSDDSDSGVGDDVDDINGSREYDFWFKHLFRLEERIADQYSLATRRCRDEAYLRGLKDAQDARKIFLEATVPAAEVS